MRVTMPKSAAADALVQRLISLGDPGRVPLRCEQGDVRLVTYSRPRLWFLRAEMDRLPTAGILLLHVAPTSGPSLWLRMTKRQFEITFDGVMETRAWLDGGEYHYPTFPRKAAKYIVPA